MSNPTTNINVPSYTQQQSNALNTSPENSLLSGLSPNMQNFLKGGLIGVVMGGRNLSDWLLIIFGGLIMLMGTVMIFIGDENFARAAQTAGKVAGVAK